MARKAKRIPRALLSPDERVVYESRPCAVKYMTSAAIVILIGLGALVVYLWQFLPNPPDLPYVQEYLDGENGEYVGYAFLGIFVLAFLYFLVKWFRWGSTVYAVTDERIITQKGILNKTYDDIPLGMVTNVDISQSIGKRVLRYGTIYFSTQSSKGRQGTVVWDAVSHPLVVRRKIQEVMDVRHKQWE